MAVKNDYISGFEDNQIIPDKMMYGYRGSAIERAAYASLKRPLYFPIMTGAIIIMIALAYMGYGYPCFLLLITSFIYSMCVSSHKGNTKLPARLPPMMKKSLSKRLLKKYKDDFGDFYVGTEHETGKQIWKSSSDFLTHTFILAGSGSGKTVLIVSVYLCNMLALGSGMWMMDFKGTVELIGNFASLALRFGRIDDLRISNYNASQKLGSVIRNSNTQNPFLSDDPYNSFVALDAFLDYSSSSSSDPFFKDNGLKILRTVLPALHDLQRKNVLRITPKLIRKYVSLEHFIKLFQDDRVSDIIKQDQLVPAYEALNLQYEGKEPKQNDEAVRLFSNFINNFDPVLQFLTDEFPQIHESPVSEFNPIDIVVNRRIATSIIPTAAKSSADVKSLAQTQVNASKTALGVGLGNNFHGSADKVMYTSRTSDDIPFCITYDEFFVGLRAEGLGTMFAQMRSTGMMGVASTQDIVALEEVKKLESGQIIGSTANKFLMLMKEPERSMAHIKPWIRTIRVPVRKLTQEYQRNSLTDSNAEIQEVPAFPAERLFSEAHFPKGRFYFIGKGHQIYGQCFYYDTDKEYRARNFRPNVQMPCINLNEFQIDRLINKTMAADNLILAINQCEIELTDTLKNSPSCLKTIRAMCKDDTNSYFADLLGLKALSPQENPKEEGVDTSNKGTDPSLQSASKASVSPTGDAIAQREMRTTPYVDAPDTETDEVSSNASSAESPESGATSKQTNPDEVSNDTGSEETTTNSEGVATGSQPNFDTAGYQPNFDTAASTDDQLHSDAPSATDNSESSAGSDTSTDEVMSNLFDDIDYQKIPTDSEAQSEDSQTIQEFLNANSPASNSKSSLSETAPSHDSKMHPASDSVGFGVAQSSMIQIMPDVVSTDFATAMKELNEYSENHGLTSANVFGNLEEDEYDSYLLKEQELKHIIEKLQS